MAEKIDPQHDGGNAPEPAEPIPAVVQETEPAATDAAAPVVAPAAADAADAHGTSQPEEYAEEPEDDDAREDAGEAGSDDGGEDGEDEYAEERVVVVRRGVFVALATVATVAIVVLAGLNIYQALKPTPAAAMVNGAAISRSTYDKAVAHGDGTQILNDLIDRKLIEQDAAKQHVTVSTDDVDNELKKVKAGFSTDAEYRQALDTQHLTEPDLRDRLRTQVLLNKLVLNKVIVADADVQKAYDAGKDTTYQGKTFDQVKDQIKQTMLQQQQSDASQSYIDKLQTGAKITRNVPGA